MCRRKRCGGDSAPKVGIFVAIVPGATVILEHAQPCTQARAGPLRLAQLPLRPEILLGTWVHFSRPGRTDHSRPPHRQVDNQPENPRKNCSWLLANSRQPRFPSASADHRGKAGCPQIVDVNTFGVGGVAPKSMSGSWPRPTESPGAWASGAWPRRTGWLFLGRVALHC